MKNETMYVELIELLTTDSASGKETAIAERRILDFLKHADIATVLRHQFAELVEEPEIQQVIVHHASD